MPEKQDKTKQVTHAAVSTSKLVISARLPTLTQLCFSRTENLLAHTSLTRLCFIGLGHKSYFEEEGWGNFEATRGTPPLLLSYLPRVRITQQYPPFATGGQLPNLRSCPALRLSILFGRSSRRRARALPSSEGAQHPRRNLNRAVELEKWEPSASTHQPFGES